MAERTDLPALVRRSWRECDMTEAEVVDVAGGKAVVYSARDPSKEGPNQDGATLFALPDGRVVIAVADGMGGLAAGERAAAEALDALAESLDGAVGREAALRDGILDGFELAHERVVAIPAVTGTTLIAVVLEGGSARPFHVGDSAALITGQRGRVKLLTPSHSPVGYAVEAGLLDEEDAFVHEERHLVSNAIGTGAMKIEVGPVVPVTPRDTLVVGSDGLFDNLRIDEIVAAVRIGTLHAAAARLAAACRERMSASDEERPGKLDDLTFVLFRAARASAGGDGVPSDG